MKKSPEFGGVSWHSTKPPWPRSTLPRKNLALVDEAYRDILLELSNRVRQGSHQPTGPAAARAVQGKRLEIKPGRGQQGKSRFITVKSGPAAKQQKKVLLALWNALGYDMGALHGRVKKQFGVDRFEWLEDGQALHILITDLQRRVNRQDKATGHC